MLRARELTAPNPVHATVQVRTLRRIEETRGGEAEVVEVEERGEVKEGGQEKERKNRRKRKEE
jgi:hypothetical protein